MQKPEKKKRRGSGRTALSILLCILIAAGCVGLTLWLNRDEILHPQIPVAAPQATDSPQAAETARKNTISQREKEEITHITVQVRGRESWTAERGEDGILYFEDGRKLEGTLGGMLQDALANLSYDEKLAEDLAETGYSLKEFGLEEPEITARVVFSDGEEITLRIGDPAPVEDLSFRYMMIDGDPTLYALNEAYAEDLIIEKEILSPVDQMTVHQSRLDRITVLDGEGQVRTEWALQGSILDADAGENWMMTVPFRYPADYDAIQNLKKNAAGLRFGMRYGDATDENRAACGLNPPTGELQLHMAEGSTGQVGAEGVYNVQDWEEETLSLKIGADRNEMTVYAEWNGGIYTVNRFTLEALTEEKESTLARYVAPVSQEALSELVIRKDGREDRYTLLEETDGDTGETKAICEKNGEKTDRTPFEAVYQRLMTVTVSGRLPEGWKPGETHTQYIFRALDGTEHVMELSAYDPLHDAVTLDGGTLFYLSRGSLPEFP